MQRDIAAAATITAATATCSALSYLFLAATSTPETEELKKKRRYYNKGKGREEAKERTIDGNNDDDDGDDDNGDDSNANKNASNNASNDDGPTTPAKQTNELDESKTKRETETYEYIENNVSAETGYTDEGDDTIYDFANDREIFGSHSIYSDDSDSDISYDNADEQQRQRHNKTNNNNNNNKSLQNTFRYPNDTDLSIQGLVYDAETHIDVDNNMDHSANHQCIYLDYNGTTPVDRRVFASMIPYLTLHFGNPSSSHAYGAAPKRAITKARRSIMELLQPRTSSTNANNGNDNNGNDETTTNNKNDINEMEERVLNESIIFTGCGTEADNMAIHLALNTTPIITKNKKWQPKKKKHIVTTNVEHPAITECLKVLQSKGEIDVTYVPVNDHGIVSARSVINAITDETVLVTIMLANNESGALQPIQDIAPYCRHRGILFHTDAAQAVGKVSIALDENGISSSVDMVTIVGHKFGAPKGIACLYVRPGCLRECGRSETRCQGYGSSGMLLVGGGQEGGRRAGTENTPYIVGMGCAADILNAKTSSKKKHRRWRKNASKMRSIRSRLLFKFKEAFQDIDPEIVRENGPKDPTKRLPNTLSIGFKNVHSGELLNKIQSTVACSAGSACHASGGKVSGVLLAMKVPMNYARGTLRLSVGPNTTIDDVDKASEIIIDEIKRQLQIEDSEQQEQDHEQEQEQLLPPAMEVDEDEDKDA